MRSLMAIVDKLDIRRAAGAGRGDHRRASQVNKNAGARRQLGGVVG